jgi:hypothetical protein
MVLIKKRNFRPYILNWLIPKLGIGMSIGDIFYVATADSAMENNLKVNGVPDSEIYHTLAAVEDVMRDGRNDVALVCPGTYTETTETNWDKNYCHLVGLGGPNVRGYDTYGTQFYCATTDINQIVHLTGTRCQFHDVTFANNYADAHNITSFLVGGYGARLVGCQFIGLMAATQCATAYNSALEVTTLGSYLSAERCIIGTTEWAAQDGTQVAPLMFTGVSSVTAPTDGVFINCQIRGQLTQGTDPLIYVKGDGGLTGGWLFDQCHFYAFSPNHTVACAQVITGDAHPYTQDVLFKDCAAVNCTAYRTASSYSQAWATGASAAAKAGIAAVCT